MLLRTNKKGLEYKINVTMQYVSLQALLVGVNDMVAFTKGIATVDGVANYINSRMIVKLLEYIPSIKKDLEERADKKTIITKDIAYALGSIKGLILSYGYDGANFYITLGLSLIKTVGTAFIIDRLDRLHQVDGVSVAVLIGCICSLPKVAKSFMTKDFVQIMLSLLTIVSLIGINYIAIKHEKNIEINYLNSKDTLKLNFSSIYSLSIIVANTLIKILSTIGIVGMQLNIIVTLIIPIVAFILSTDIEELSKNIDKYLSFNDGCIDGINLSTISAVFKRIIELADVIEEMPTLCPCGRKARFNMKFVYSMPDFDSRDTINLKEEENIQYVSVCRDCYFKIKNGQLDYHNYIKYDNSEV